MKILRQFLAALWNTADAAPVPVPVPVPPRPRTAPPICPLCDGARRSPIAAGCSCGCGTVINGRGLSCPACGGAGVVPAAVAGSAKEAIRYGVCFFVN